MKTKPHMVKPQFSMDLRSAPFQDGGEGGLRLNLAEREFESVVAQIEERIVHHSDRPEIELNILAFLEHALGPTTEGVAAMMGISPEAADVHLRALSEANRIWGQSVHGEAMAWHISHEGRHFLAERGAVASAV